VEAVDENISYSSYVATVCKRKRIKLANRTNDSVWETLAQRRKIACICTPFKAYTAERIWKCIGDRLKGPCYLSRDDHGRKIRDRKRNTDIGKYSSVIWAIKLLNQLPAEVIATFLCKTHIFRKKVRKVIISEEKQIVTATDGFIVTERLLLFVSSEPVTPI